MDFETQRRALAESGASLLTFRETDMFTDYGRGIRPVLDRLAADPDFFRGAAVADKVVGRSAALLFLYGGVSQVYAGVLSVPAEEVLRVHGVPYACSERVPMIRNRTGDGFCPMEQRVLTTEDPAEAYAVLRRAVYPDKPE